MKRFPKRAHTHTHTQLGRSQTERNWGISKGWVSVCVCVCGRVEWLRRNESCCNQYPTSKVTWRHVRIFHTRHERLYLMPDEVKVYAFNAMVLFVDISFMAIFSSFFVFFHLRWANRCCNWNVNHFAIAKMKMKIHESPEKDGEVKQIISTANDQISNVRVRNEHSCDFPKFRGKITSEYRK